MSEQSTFRADWESRFGRGEPKVVCVGLNYVDHASESKGELARARPPRDVPPG
jgi:2-keto-4-pentenoate hydratase/2-oxohepta-3-ene-1,7-dioic acid hydratase in catechol pathway